MRGGKLSKPATLKLGHVLSDFDCGRDEVSSWLKTRARKAAENDTARTYVVCRGPKKVVGYYALAAGAVSQTEAPGALRRNTPEPIPVIILALLGVDRSEQGKGIGKDLLADAMRRAIQAAKIIGARALLIHALDGNAANFYIEHGFQAFDEKAETLYLAMKTIRDAL
jgi:GNAT superfamily N-acetyltransferase